MLCGCELLLGFDDLDYGSTSGGPTSSCQAVDPPSDDTFVDETTTLAKWKQLYTAGQGLSVQEGDGGELHILPNKEDKYWWQTKTAPFLFQTVCGDFAFRIYAVADNGFSVTSPVGEEHSGAGILLRDPTINSTRWLLFEVGYDAETTSFGVSIWHTAESVSTHAAGHYGNNAWAAHLQVCRIAGKFYLYAREGGMGQTVHFPLGQDFGLPSEIQVGMTAQRSTQSPTRGVFRYASFEVLPTTASCIEALEKAAQQ